MPSGKGEKNKTIRFVTMKDYEEIDFDDAVKEVKAREAKATKGAKDKPSSGGKPSKKPKTSRIDSVIKKV